MGQRRRRFSLAVVFVLAVLGPSVGLSLLALRAASREALFVERRFEGSLLAEVNHAAARIAEVLQVVMEDLAAEAERIDSDVAALARWKKEEPLVSVPFLLQDGRVTISDAEGDGGAAFLATFGPFLEGRSNLPVYDDIADVYRKQMRADVSDGDGVSAGAVPFPYDTPGRRNDGGKGQESAAHEETEGAEFLLAPARESLSTAGKTEAPVFEAFAPDPRAKMVAPKGFVQQLVSGFLKNDAAVEEETYQKAVREGFQMLERNVLPQAALQAPALFMERAAPVRSKTVVQGRLFADLRREGPSGILPRLSDEGLELLFWTRGREKDGVTGCTLNMHLLRERFVAALPEILSDVRVLTVLNEAGEPLFVPPGAGGLEWKKPFVAREISSLLPRWEVGAWLVDPGMIASLARTTNLAVWLLVAVLLVTVATGGTVVLRTLSAEMRLARQKTTFVANVSHELKTPLTSIRLFAEMLLQHRQPDEARRDDYLRTMVSEAERLSRLVDNVLTFSRRDADNPDCIKERLNLAELVRETVEQLRPHLVLHGFSLRVEAPEMLPVQGHAEGLRQVLMNLLSNAEKYSEGCREVTVIVCSEGDEAVVEVADRGVGVPPSQAARIFEEFYRGDDSLTSTRRGTGLGLSIARHIARKHGGDVTFRPRDGGGSIFSLRIPAGNDATRKGAGA